MKKRMKIVSIVMVLVLCLIVVSGCTDNETTSQPEENVTASQEDTNDNAASEDTNDTVAAEDWKVGYSNMQVEEDFFITVSNGLATAAEENGLDFEETFAGRDAALMTQNIEALVTKGADIIIDFNVLQETGEAIAADLAKEDIPMISIDCLYDGAYFFGVNNQIAGETLGEYAVEAVGDKFGGELEYIVGIFDSNAGDEVLKRVKGATEVLCADLGISEDDVVWLDTQADDVLTGTMTKDWLNAHPDASKVLFIAYNDDRAYATNNSIESLERIDDCLLVSHNADPASIENLQKHAAAGDTAWVASVSYNSHLYGQQIIDMAKSILSGEDVEQSVYTQVTVVTLDNVDQYVEERDATLESMK